MDAIHLFMCIYNIDIKMMPFIKLQFLNYNFSDIGIIRINQSVSTEIKRNSKIITLITQIFI